MKRIHELKEQRSKLIEDLTNITKTAEVEKRFKTPEELEKWNSIKTLVDELDAEVQTLQAEEDLNKEGVKNEVENEVENNSRNEERNYDIVKALDAMINNRSLSGYEAEVQEQAVKDLGRNAQGLYIPGSVMRSFTAEGFKDTHFDKVTNFSTSAEGGILEKLGVTQYNNAKATIGLVFNKGINAGIYNEGEAVADSSYEQKYATLQPRRIQGSMTFSKSYLSQTATTADLIMQINAAVEKAASAELMKQIVENAELTLAGRTSADAVAPLTWDDAMLLQSAVEVEDIVSGRFVTGKSLYHGLKTIKKDAGSGLFMMENGLIDGVEVVNAGSKVGANKMVFGDFKEAYIAWFSEGIEILVDPFTLASRGEVKITFVKMGDAKVNPYAFRTIQNIG